MSKQVILPTLDPQLFENIRRDLSVLRTAFEETQTPGAQVEHLRSMTEAELILNHLDGALSQLFEFFRVNPTLVKLFEKQFFELTPWLNRESIVEVCFLENFVHPEKELYPLHDHDMAELKHQLSDFSRDLEEFQKSSLENHQQTLDVLRGECTLEQLEAPRSCPCALCLAEYRTKLREQIFEVCESKVIELREWLKENMDLDVEDISHRHFQLQKDVDRLIRKFRHQLRRASVNKLEFQVRSLMKKEFAPTSEVGQSYFPNMYKILKGFLKDSNLAQDLVSEYEFRRFFEQMGLNLWRGRRYLLREFGKFVNSILRLKRKDISAGILKDYLGQFWLHSEARRFNRKIVYHMGPTNSGKTYHAIKSLCESKSGCYLAPLRLLASELYDTMNEQGVKTNLLTGEEVIETPGAHHYAATVEMAKLHEDVDCAVIDEIQMITDPQRGWAWTRALVNLRARTIHVCGDGSVLELLRKILKLTGDDLEIETYKRLTDLKVAKDSIKLADLQRSDALICFSRRNALKYKADLENIGFKVSIVYGRLGPEVRRQQAKKFDEGTTDIMVSTDAIAMGMNLPIKRIVFSTLSKFIDSKEYPISDSEIKQIGGRAGRFQRFPVGEITCLSRVNTGLEKIEKAMNIKLDQKTQAMVGPDLEIFNQVNRALRMNRLPVLLLSEFLRLFNTMTFTSPFYCVDLKEMIELAEMVEASNERKKVLTSSEIFGFSCAPVNIGLVEHVQYFIYILNNYINGVPIKSEVINATSTNIDYLETSIKCTELYQWLARHFSNKNFSFEERDLLFNKGEAIERLNELLSDYVGASCSSCGKKLPINARFSICDECFRKRGPRRPRRRREGERGPRRGGGGGRGHQRSASEGGEGKDGKPFPQRRRLGGSRGLGRKKLEFAADGKTGEGAGQEAGGRRRRGGKKSRFNQGGRSRRKAKQNTDKE